MLSKIPQESIMQDGSDRRYQQKKLYQMSGAAHPLTWSPYECIGHFLGD